MLSATPPSHSRLMAARCANSLELLLHQFAIHAAVSVCLVLWNDWVSCQTLQTVQVRHLSSTAASCDVNVCTITTLM